MTLRDVFRWARRLATDSTCDDWLQVLANHGYFLLAGRCRNQKDVDSVVETLENELRRKIEPSKLFAVNSPYMPKDADTKGIVMTLGMRRMLVMTEQAWLRNEAVLMIGETGGGKTSLAQAVGRGNLMTINCHERTETADLLGRLRPREKGGFAWSDGIVISAMKAGAPLLIDEISLAEDSVLERLNPLFEEDRTLLLSDSGVEAHPIKAEEGFQIIATMNPGGDYGKKELVISCKIHFSYPKLCVTVLPKSGQVAIMREASFFLYSTLELMENSKILLLMLALHPILLLAGSKSFSKNMLTYSGEAAISVLHAPSVRDVVACAEIYAACIDNGLTRTSAVYEAISAVFLDALGSSPVRMTINLETVRSDAEKLLCHLSHEETVSTSTSLVLQENKDRLSIGGLSVVYGPLKPSKPKAFSLRAPTCVSNFYRIARGLLINKPILLEGAPGCGKSSTVMALAQLTGHPITRLNLSDQTDLSDLFGSDVPIVTDDGSISFRWEDGPVLRAIKRGEWVLLDEIYVEDLTKEDILFILKELPISAQINDSQLEAMVSITMHLASEQNFCGGPFPFNLRDILRWVSLFRKNGDMASCFDVLYVRRMRNAGDRQKVRDLYAKLFKESCIDAPVVVSADEKELRVGNVRLPRTTSSSFAHRSSNRILPAQSVLMHQYAVCADMQWLCLVIGPRNCGKRSTLENLAQICGAELHSIILNSETDAQELIGSYEQVVDDSAIVDAKASLRDILNSHVEQSAVNKVIAAGDITELETVTELVLADVKENMEVVTECREVLAHAARSAMRFEWRDSLFVKAYLEGHWLLIEDVNLC
ncbi:ATPase family protein, partial [Oesophagostomum dentatum]